MAKEIVRLINKTHRLRKATAAWEAMVTKTTYVEPEIWMSPTEYEAELTLRVVIEHHKVLLSAWKDGKLEMYGITAKVTYEQALRQGYRE